MLSKKHNKPQRSNISGSKVAFNLGINDYRGTQNDLRGCVNDASAWQKLYSQYGYTTTFLKDSEVVQSEVRSIFRELEKLSNKYGENFKGALTFSGHGTHTADKNKDESDGRDEAWVLWDGLLVDDHIRRFIDSMHPSASLTIISDSCHSGTMTRSVLGLFSEEGYVKPRYLPPEDELEAAMEVTTRNQLLSPKGRQNEVLLTGCNASQYSYDAYLGGKYMGAMTYNATNILKAKGNISFEKLYHLLRKELPSNIHPQSPQLEGKRKNKEKLFF